MLNEANRILSDAEGRPVAERGERSLARPSFLVPRSSFLARSLFLVPCPLFLPRSGPW